MAEYITHTVDDEDAKCERCDNADLPHAFCVKNCGAEHGWCGYQRTEKVDENYVKRIRIK